MKTSLRLFFLFASAQLQFTAGANISPRNGAVLNFNQVMFEYDETAGADQYIISIRPVGDGNVITVKNSSLAFIQYNGLQFGKKYEWSYKAFKNNKPVFESAVFSFSIAASFQTDPAFFRSVVDISEKDGYRDGIIFLDYMGMAINRKGEPVWYMPVSKDSLDNLKMRNIKMTAAGTITYLDNTDCFEKDISGNIAWKAPNDGRVSGDKLEYYHHDFFKMKDGSYITSGYRFVNEPNFYNNSVTTKVRYNTLIQYNNNKEILWWWDESKHADKRSLYGDSGGEATEVAGTHLNGVAYYEPDDAFILSFRDNSSILKVSHKTGEVLYNLGDSLMKITPGELPFVNQHGPSLLRNGAIVVYNNNLNKSGRISKASYPIVRVFSQPRPGKQSEKIWEYECVSDKYPDGIFGKEGYASQLPYSDNLLVCMGGANYLFEVTPGKKVVWQCSLQQFDMGTGQWSNINNYRCSYAASLYPCYFTLQQAVFYHTKDNTPALSFRINNEGTNDNSFVAEVKDEKGGLIKKSSSGIIAAGKNEVIRIEIPEQHNTVTVTVYPVGNKDLVRELRLKKNK